MTNRELLNMPRSRLSEVDKQRLFLLRVEGTPMPACGSRPAPGRLGLLKGGALAIVG